MVYKDLPYGMSNFADLVESNYAYVDKTRFVEFLEKESCRYQFFVRPRRFGKSLFLSVMENYYDFNKKDKFESTFGDFYIGKHPTSEQGKYAVVRFDFSGVKTDNHDEFKVSFSNNVQETIRSFFDLYQNVFPDAKDIMKRLVSENLGTDAVSLLCNVAYKHNIPVFVIIDEYDSFANNLIAIGDAYKNEMGSDGSVRTFYETLKKGTTSSIKRIFITGISPMMATDLTSGFNMAINYSLSPKYNEMFGFTHEEVNWLINETGIDRNLIKKVDMEAYYNGYLFNQKGESKVYNSQMILFVFNQIKMTGEQPEEIVDANLKTDYGRLRRLAGNENNRKKLLSIALDGGIFGSVVGRFSQNELEKEEYFISLLFYLGMLTIGGFERGEIWLKIPNYSIKTLFWEYLISYIQCLEQKETDFSEITKASKGMAYDGDYNSFLNYFVENYLKRLSNRDLMVFDEKYIKVMMLAILFGSSLYHPISENENMDGYCDIYLQRHHAVSDVEYEYIFELKYVKTDTAEKEKEAKFAEAFAQLEEYKKDPRFVGRNDIKFIAIVFAGKGNFEAREN